jgi:hypothetical protein
MDEELQLHLWRVSEELTGIKGEIIDVGESTTSRPNIGPLSLAEGVATASSKGSERPF